MMVGSPWSGRLIGRYGTRPSLYAAGTFFLLSTLLMTQLTRGTPLAVLLAAYALFGLGLGMVNPAIANSAVAGMPLAQAGVAAALGVAIAGTVVSSSRAKGSSFALATHPIWWIMPAQVNQAADHLISRHSGEVTFRSIVDFGAIYVSTAAFVGIMQGRVGFIA